MVETINKKKRKNPYVQKTNLEFKGGRIPSKGLKSVFRRRDLRYFQVKNGLSIWVGALPGPVIVYHDAAWWASVIQKFAFTGVMSDSGTLACL